MSAPLMSPGHRLPRRGLARADIWVRLVLVGIAVATTTTGVLTLWLAGQLGGLLTHGAWPDTTVGDAPGIAVRLAVNAGDPQQAWPTPARTGLPPGWVLYPLWTALAAGVTIGFGGPTLRVARRHIRRQGFASHRDLNRVVTAAAVTGKADVLRPALRIRADDDPATAADKQARRADPLQVARRLGYHALSGEPLYLANEFSELIAGAARFANKTTRFVIPRVIDAKGPVISTSTRLDVAEVTFDVRAKVGPTTVFEPQGTIPGVPRLRWSPIAGCQDPVVAILRARGFAAGAGLQEGVENGQYFRDQAAMIIRGLLHAAALDPTTTLADVMRWSTNPSDSRPEKILRHHDMPWADRLTQHREATGRSRETIASVVSGSLDVFNDPRVLKACSPSRDEQFDATGWLAESGTLYLVGTRDAQLAVAPLFAALCEDVIYRARTRALTAPGGRLEPPLYFLGDEFTNIAPAPSTPSLVGDGGGAGIPLSLVCQNFHQLEDKFGRAGGQAIRDGANCRLVLGGTQDVAALRDAQSLMGQVREMSSSASWGSGRASVQENSRRENLVDLADLRNLPTGRALVLLGNMPPVEITMPAWWQRDDADTLTAARDAFTARLARAA